MKDLSALKQIFTEEIGKGFLNTTPTSLEQRLALCPGIDQDISDYTTASRCVDNLGFYF